MAASYRGFPITTHTHTAASAPVSSAPGAASDAALELEHVAGYTGRHAGTLVCSPAAEQGFVCGLGATVVLADVTDPHAQTFLRGHDADVCALDVSPSSAIIASGQVRSPVSATADSPVFVWETRSQRAIHAFRGLTGGITAVKCSPDDVFVAAASVDMMLAIWDVATGEQIFMKRQGTGGGTGGITFLAWAPIDRSTGARPTYKLAFNANDRIMMAVLSYDYKIMRYVVDVRAGVFPAAGYIRHYTCGGIDATGTALLCGTTAGELVTFSLTPAFIFRGAVPVASHGVHSIALPRGPSGAADRYVAYCGGGDGSIRCMVGRDASWVCTGEALVLGRVAALSLSASSTWMLVGTSLGHMYRVSFGCNLTFGVPPAAAGPAGKVTPSQGAIDQLEASHTAQVSAVAFIPGVSDAMVTVSADNSIRVWNLNTYSVTYTHYAPHGSTPLSVWADAPRDRASAPAAPAAPGLPCEIFVGFSDGTLRCYCASAPTASDGRGSKEEWRKVAHRGSTTSVSGNAAVVMTGGEDGRVCVWSRKAREMLIQFSDHGKPIVAVRPHVSSLETIFSVGADRLINTYSLRAEKRVKMHAMPRTDMASSSFLSVAQNTDASSQLELFTGTSDGRIICWDVDVPDVPLGVTNVAALLAARSGQPVRGELRLNSISMSPSGRYIAAAAQDGQLIVLKVGTPSAMPALRGGRASDFTVHGVPSAALAAAASVADMRILAVSRGFSAFLDVKWAPDEKQIVAVAQDACISVFNWYGEA